LNKLEMDDDLEPKAKLPKVAKVIVTDGQCFSVEVAVAVS